MASRNSCVKFSIHTSVILSMMIVLHLLSISHGMSCGSCPIGWHAWGNACYLNIINDRLRTWGTAKTICKNFGANLATPNSVAEHDFIYDFYRSSYPNINPSGGVWIGCTDKAQEGVWVCSGDDDSGALYRPPFQLNNPNYASYDCVVVSTQKTYNIWHCSDLKNVMCEKQAPPTCRKPTSCFSVSNGRCLVNHTLDVTTTERPSRCCIACNASPQCRSFNLIGDRCELNNATRFDVDRSRYFKEIEDCIYYEL